MGKARGPCKQEDARRVFGSQSWRLLERKRRVMHANRSTINIYLGFGRPTGSRSYGNHLTIGMNRPAIEVNHLAIDPNGAATDTNCPAMGMNGGTTGHDGPAIDPNRRTTG